MLHRSILEFRWNRECWSSRTMSVTYGRSLFACLPACLPNKQSILWCLLIDELHHQHWREVCTSWWQLLLRSTRWLLLRVVYSKERKRESKPTTVGSLKKCVEFRGRESESQVYKLCLACWKCNCALLNESECVCVCASVSPLIHQSQLTVCLLVCVCVHCVQLHWSVNESKRVSEKVGRVSGESILLLMGISISISISITTINFCSHFSGEH